MTRVPAFLALVLFGCGTGEPACHVGADCASGACRADGACEPVKGRAAADAVNTDAAPDALLSVDAEAEQDEGPAPVDAIAPQDDAPETPDVAPAVCVQNKDGTIVRAEVPLAAGLHAMFKVGLDTAVDTAGTTDAGGKRTWDLSGALAGDHGVLLETQPLVGTWFAADFAGATYAARLSDTADLLGVFEVTDDALLLRGVVSPADGVFATKLTYDPPVTVLAFPLKAGATWKTEADVTGVAQGVGCICTETYESQIDAAGTIVTPYGTFEALRVRVTLDRLVGFLPTTIRSFLWVAECFGTVATATSKDNEDEVEFTTAAEVRRLAP